MGSGQKAHDDAMRDAALTLLLEVGAVTECEHDPGIYLDQRTGTEGARALGLKLIKVKDRRVSAIKSRQELSAAIDAALEGVEVQCPLCTARKGTAGG